MSLRALLRLPFIPRRGLVRPWALISPILILLLTVPLLRPLRHPDPQMMSDDEQARLATVQAIVEGRTLAIERTLFGSTHQRIQVGPHLYSNQPPVFAVLLSGPYWLMHHSGMTLERNPLWVMFLLTLVGVAIPVALSAGIVYKMGRMFELSRPRRALLGLGVVLGSGLVSYATVLNAHAPAATLLLASAACLFHVGLINHAGRASGWLLVAGFCAALSAAIDPPALIFTILLLLVVGSFRWPVAARAGALVVYCIGAALPLYAHATLNRPITGDLRPGYLHRELADSASDMTPDSGPRQKSLAWTGDALRPGTETPASLRPLFPPPSRPSAMQVDDDDDDSVFGHGIWRDLGRLIGAFLGSHGIFSHFPIVVLGIIGVTMVMHRHWPASTKMLASITLGGALAIIVLFARSDVEWRDAMFATRWFVLFLPLTLFWAGAWLRRHHRPTSWAIVGSVFAFSAGVAVIGATGPLPRGGFDRYTAVAAVQNLLHPSATDGPPMLAGR